MHETSFLGRNMASVGNNEFSALYVPCFHAPILILCADSLPGRQQKEAVSLSCGQLVRPEKKPILAGGGRYGYDRVPNPPLLSPQGTRIEGRGLGAHNVQRGGEGKGEEREGERCGGPAMNGRAGAGDHGSDQMRRDGHKCPLSKLCNQCNPCNPPVVKKKTGGSRGGFLLIETNTIPLQVNKPRISTIQSFRAEWIRGGVPPAQKYWIVEMWVLLGGSHR